MMQLFQYGLSTLMKGFFTTHQSCIFIFFKTFRRSYANHLVCFSENFVQCIFIIKLDYNTLIHQLNFTSVKTMIIVDTISIVQSVRFYPSDVYYN